MGHTGGFENRIEIFMNKCAPIQINFLGYPGTSGTNKIDFNCDIQFCFWVLKMFIRFALKNRKIFWAFPPTICEKFQKNDIKS